MRRFWRCATRAEAHAEIGAELGLEPEAVSELVEADEAQAVAHRIATGEEPMYPAPAPGEQMVDTRSGSATVPLIALGVIFVIILIYLALR